MNRTYNTFIDNGLFVAEYILKKPYQEISNADLSKNTYLFADKIGQLIEEKEFYRKIVFTTHLNSCLTNRSKKKNIIPIIREQFDELIEDVSEEKNCIYCGKKQVNTDLQIDRKYMYGLVSQTFYNSANNLQTVDMCPVCAFLSLLSILNIQKIGMPTLYDSDSDSLMRQITKNILENIEKDIIPEHDPKQKSDLLLDMALQSNEDVGYIKQVGFMNSGQVINDNELILYKKDIELTKKLNQKGLLDEFKNLGLHIRMAMRLPLYTNSIYISSKLLKTMEEFDLKKDEKEIIEYASQVLMKIEDIDKLLKDLKLCNNKNRFNTFIINYSTKKSLVKNVENYDMLTGNNWYRYRDYITMELLTKTNREEKDNE